MKEKIIYFSFLATIVSSLFGCESVQKENVQMKDFIQTANAIRAQHKSPVTIAYVSRYDYKQ